MSTASTPSTPRSYVSDAGGYGSDNPVWENYDDEFPALIENSMSHVPHCQWDPSRVAAIIDNIPDNNSDPYADYQPSEHASSYCPSVAASDKDVRVESSDESDEAEVPVPPAAVPTIKATREHLKVLDVAHRFSNYHWKRESRGDYPEISCRTVTKHKDTRRHHH